MWSKSLEPSSHPFVLPLDVQYTHSVQASVGWFDRHDFNTLKGDWDDARLRGAYRQRQYSVQWCVSVRVWLFLLLGGVRYLLVVQAEDVMHELVLLARLDHPTPAQHTRECTFVTVYVGLNRITDADVYVTCPDGAGTSSSGCPPRPQSSAACTGWRWRWSSQFDQYQRCGQRWRRLEGRDKNTKLCLYAVILYLQCTTVGPAKGGASSRALSTCCTSSRRGGALSGVFWSGHEVYQ